MWGHKKKLSTISQNWNRNYTEEFEIRATTGGSEAEWVHCSIGLCLSNELQQYSRSIYLLSYLTTPYQLLWLWSCVTGGKINEAMMTDFYAILSWVWRQPWQAARSSGSTIRSGDILVRRFTEGQTSQVTMLPCELWRRRWVLRCLWTVEWVV